MEHQIARNRRRSTLLVIAFLAVWAVAGALIGLLAGSGSGAAGGAVIAVIVALLVIAWSLLFGRGTVLALAGAVPADPNRFQELHHVVEALAIGDNVPKPEVYVVDDPSPNAFATGFSPQHSAVTVTTGLLEMMNREELEGVLSHELSHVRNHDTRLLLIVATMVGFAAMLASFIWSSMWRVRFGRDSGQAAIFLLLLGLVLTIIGVVVGPLMQLAISRQRESLADASGVELTRNPAGLLSALKKIAVRDKPLQKFNHATAAMYIDNPLEHHQHWFHGLFDTHPPIEERIATLERMLQVRET
ncbi:MAG TPA: M48 family metallopeptidase [Candidatus Dormibacteraeota bacterium]